jgi:hypothetical protein
LADAMPQPSADTPASSDLAKRVRISARVLRQPVAWSQLPLSTHNCSATASICVSVANPSVQEHHGGLKRGPPPGDLMQLLERCLQVSLLGSLMATSLTGASRHDFNNSFARW